MSTFGPDPAEWVDIIASVAGGMTPAQRRFIAGQVRRRQERLGVIFRAIKLIVVEYYENYTDATHIEDSFVDALEAISGESFMQEELVAEAIREAEAQINADGGVEGTDGLLHTVRTESAYEDVDDA